MADIKKLVQFVGGIPAAVDLTASGNVLQSETYQIVKAATVASKPVKLDADKKLISGDIDLTAEVTGILPVANGGTGSSSEKYIPLTQRAANNGVATLDSGGKIPAGQLPASVMEFKGTYSPVSHTPRLADSGKASQVIQDLTYVAKAAGQDGNLITVAYTTGGSNGAEVVTVVNNAISVQIEDSVSTANQINTAILGSIPASALVDVTVSGTGANAQVAVGATALTGGMSVGDVFKVSAAGSHNFGSGSITLIIGDVLYFNGTIVEMSHSGADAVLSVNGQTSVVVLDTDDVSDSSATNKYYTAAAARGDLIAASISNGDTTHSPDGNSVFDALALKQTTTLAEANILVGSSGNVAAAVALSGDATIINTGSLTIGADKVGASKIRLENNTYLRARNQANGADVNILKVNASDIIEFASFPITPTAAPDADYEVANKKYVDDQVALAGSASLVIVPGVAGESFAANKTFVVRYGITSETAGRVYKASKLIPADKKYWAIGIIQTVAALSAGDVCSIIKAGEVSLKSGDTNVASGSESFPLFIGDAGAFSVAAPATGVTSGDAYASVIIGQVKIYNATVTNTVISVEARQVNGIDIA